MNGARLIITHLDDTWTTYIFGETEREHGEIRAQSWHRESNGITVYLSGQVREHIHWQSMKKYAVSTNYRRSRVTDIEGY